MRILAAGATGFLGRALTKRLLADGHSVTILSRDASRATQSTGLPAIAWSDETAWRQAVADADAVVNLTGENIAGERWNPDIKKRLLTSRTEPALALASARPKVLVQAAAVGIYGERGEEEITERSPIGDDFLAEIGQKWESAALTAETHGTRVVLLRIGQVLGRGGGALEAFLNPPMVPFSPAKLGLGGPLGDGHYWMPWVHVDDVVGLFSLALDDPRASGPINAVAPGIVRGGDFARALGKALNRPANIPVPLFALRLLVGEFADYLVRSQKVVPETAANLGYKFQFPELRAALESLDVSR